MQGCKRTSLTILFGIIIFFLGACTGKQPNDPFEAYNRKMYAFNKVVDTGIIKPAAQVYHTLTPWPVRKGVSNFFRNLSTITIIPNDLLQGDLVRTAEDFWRFLINTTLGLGGLIDVAEHLGLPYQKNDTGVTLAKWGIKESPYFILPIIGPSTIRDTVGFAADLGLYGIYSKYIPDYASYGLTGLQFVQLRDGLLETDKIIEDSLDPYAFQRDAYLQHRHSLLKEQVPDLDTDDYVEGSHSKSTKQSNGLNRAAKSLRDGQPNAQDFIDNDDPYIE